MGVSFWPSTCPACAGQRFGVLSTRCSRDSSIARSPWSYCATLHPIFPFTRRSGNSVWATMVHLQLHQLQLHQLQLHQQQLHQTSAAARDTCGSRTWSSSSHSTSAHARRAPPTPTRPRWLPYEWQQCPTSSGPTWASTYMVRSEPNNTSSCWWTSTRGTQSSRKFRRLRRTLWYRPWRKSSLSSASRHVSSRTMALYLTAHSSASLRIRSASATIASHRYGQERTRPASASCATWAQSCASRTCHTRHGK